MTAKESWSNDKKEFVEKFNALKERGFLYRGDTYNIEVPVDKTSKYTIPVDGIIMHLLDYKDEPTFVKNDLTWWAPRERGSSGEGGTESSDSNVNRPPQEEKVKSNKRVSYRKIFIELPFDARLDYGTGRTKRKLRMVSIKCHPIISINSLLYLFSNNYFEKTPRTFRTWRSTWRIPGTAFPIDKFGEFSNKREAGTQKTGDMADRSTRGRTGGRTQVKRQADNTGDTP